VSEGVDEAVLRRDLGVAEPAALRGPHRRGDDAERRLAEDALRVGELQVLRRGERRGGRDPGARRAEERPELLDARGDRLLRRAAAEGHERRPGRARVAGRRDRVGSVDGADAAGEGAHADDELALRTVAAAAQPPAPSPTACSTVRAAPSSWPTSAVFCARAAATPAAPGLKPTLPSPFGFTCRFTRLRVDTYGSATPADSRLVIPNSATSEPALIVASPAAVVRPSDRL
jgi:hypothetical protein